MKMIRPSRPRPFVDKLATLDTTPIVIRARRTRALLLMAVCVVFVLFGLYAITRGSRAELSIGWPTLVLFALGAAIAGVLAARPPIMTISRDGIEMQTIFRTWSLGWGEVQGFMVHRMRVSGPTSVWTTADMAAYTRHDAPPPTRFAWLRRPHDIHGGFGPGWPLSARQLVELLNAARTTALQDGVPPPKA
jgi:hypothetical protein